MFVKYVFAVYSARISSIRYLWLNDSMNGFCLQALARLKSKVDWWHFAKQTSRHPPSTPRRSALDDYLTRHVSGANRAIGLRCITRCSSAGSCTSLRTLTATQEINWHVTHRAPGEHLPWSRSLLPSRLLPRPTLSGELTCQPSQFESIESIFAPCQTILCGLWEWNSIIQTDISGVWDTIWRISLGSLCYSSHEHALASRGSTG